ncbi:MAG TPA: bifunctional 3-deoxy-7-phosphoheptulonate synthase/chorismate mutase [Candidatus Eisenbacteria bacterium]|nr:bifunctional 3-deoxy-7-phosphoheptulonate synthase/chorismate mutase [Candidatus Eisenbacteria bacterium]
MTDSRLTELRHEIDLLNESILASIQRRGSIVLEIAAIKRARGLAGYDAKREEEMLQSLTSSSSGPFGPADVKEIFKTIFRASLDLQNLERRKGMRVLRRDLVPESGFLVGDVPIGGPEPVLFVGPCSVETAEQIEAIAEFVAGIPGPKILRAGAFKPRTNPYTFQGLREEGLRLLRDAADRHGLVVVTEVLDTATVDVVAEHADMLQIGARNMYNTELLKAVGRVGKPVLLKRAFMATLEELLLSAEYILAGGNDRVVLCERGIRTFERTTRFTLDIAAVPLLKQEVSLPVIVDLSHALGRKDIMLPCAKAALAVGANGLMIEIHNRPDQALSDGFQQFDLKEFAVFLDNLGHRAATVPEPALGGRNG